MSYGGVDLGATEGGAARYREAMALRHLLLLIYLTVAVLSLTGLLFRDLATADGLVLGLPMGLALGHRLGCADAVRDVGVHEDGARGRERCGRRGRVVSAEAQILLVVGAYLALNLFVGWRAARSASDSATGFVAGDRSMGPVLMYFVTGATIFSAFAFLGAPGRAFSTGAAAFHILAFGVLGFLPFYWTGPAAARLGRRKGYITQAELVAGELGFRPLAPVMAVVSLLAFVPYLALQMRGAGHVLEVLTSGAMSVEVGAAVVYGVVLLYVWHSGVMGVGWTNTLQGLFMMIMAWSLGLYLPRALHGSVGEMFRAIDPEFLRLPGGRRAGG